MTRTELQTPWSTVLLFACLGWLALVLAPAVAAAPYADLLRWMLHPICHQIPERSLHWFGEPLGACARCTGLYVGFTAGVAVWPQLPGLADKLASRPRWIVVFMVPLMIDVVIANTAPSRFTTGLVAAFPAALLPLLAIAQFRETKEPINKRR